MQCQILEEALACKDPRAMTTVSLTEHKTEMTSIMNILTEIKIYLRPQSKNLLQNQIPSSVVSPSPPSPLSHHLLSTKTAVVRPGTDRPSSFNSADLTTSSCPDACTAYHTLMTRSEYYILHCSIRLRHMTTIHDVEFRHGTIHLPLRNWIPFLN